MRYFIIILTFFFFVSVHGKKNKTLPCSEYVRKLIFAEKEFTGCAVENSVPVSFCDSCKDDYDLLTVNYANFVNANDTSTKTNVSCRSIYFDRDRMNIVETVYNQLTGLWNKGFCSECWTDRNETEDMLADINDFKSCILKERKQPCIACEQHYLKINSMYESIERSHKGKICFDIQDMMNKTRITWSRDLKCCKRESNLVAYSAVSGSVAFLVILFYCSMIIITKRAERNHGTIDNANGEDITTNNITRNVASTETNATSNRSQPASNLRFPTISPEPSTSHSSENKLTTYCTACANEYHEIEVLYKEFMEGSDSITTKKCKEEYKDDLKVINYIYNYSQLLWKELTCKECQVNLNETESFLKDCTHFHDCVNENGNESCTKCNNIYQKILGAYNEIREETPRRLCGEISENMRHVQTVWAKNHCNKQQKSSLTVFLAVSSALMLLPGIFYGGLASKSYNQCSENGNEDRPTPVEDGSGSREALPTVEPSSSNNKKYGKTYDKKVGDISDESTDNEEVILDLNDPKQELLKLAQQLEVPPKEGITPRELLESNNSSDEEPVLPSPLAPKSQITLLDI